MGIELYRDKLINWLVEGPSNSTMISVVGIDGVGKTTLVKKVYDNKKVVAHFNCRAWITVSQSYKKKDLFRDMIKQFYEARKEFAPKEIEKMEEINLIEVLSGIVIITRNEDFAPSHNESSSCYVHKQLPLPSDKALELSYKKVFQHEEDNCPHKLVELSCKIAERCEGLPLAIVVIGVLLSSKDKVVSEWVHTEDNDVEFNVDLPQAVKIPNGIGHLQSLQKLSKIAANNNALIVELGSLGQLRKLEIAKLKRENGIALCTVLETMSHLQSLRIRATNEGLDFGKVKHIPCVDLGENYNGYDLGDSELLERLRS
nr:disease resistance protein RPM1-like [Quercus suber]XP_023925789.1 disease resistance protein RPM1-like [Quercus suber]